MAAVRPCGPATSARRLVSRCSQQQGSGSQNEPKRALAHTPCPPTGAPLGPEEGADANTRYVDRPCTQRAAAGRQRVCGGRAGLQGGGLSQSPPSRALTGKQTENGGGEATCPQPW